MPACCVAKPLSSAIVMSSQLLQGHTALMKACQNGQKRAAELLLAAGADVTAQDTEVTPLLLLTNKDHPAPLPICWLHLASHVLIFLAENSSCDCLTSCWTGLHHCSCTAHFSIQQSSWLPMYARDSVIGLLLIKYFVCSGIVSPDMVFRMILHSTCTCSYPPAALHNTIMVL